jgi:beta-lactamase class A
VFNHLTVPASYSGTTDIFPATAGTAAAAEPATTAAAKPATANATGTDNSPRLNLWICFLFLKVSRCVHILLQTSNFKSAQQNITLCLYNCTFASKLSIVVYYE